MENNSEPNEDYVLEKKQKDTYLQLISNDRENNSLLSIFNSSQRDGVIERIEFDHGAKCNHRHYKCFNDCLWQTAFVSAHRLLHLVHFATFAD